MKEEFIPLFINAAKKVILTETNISITPVNPGDVKLQHPTYTSKDVTVMVGVTGNIQGTILYGMDESTAVELASRISKSNFKVFDNMVSRAIREICNVITSAATVEIGKMGYISKITPPTLIIGSGVKISTFSLQRILIPIQTKLGKIDISGVLVDKSLVPERLAI